MRECASWSEPLLIAHTTLLEISSHGSNTFCRPMELLNWQRETSLSRLQVEVKLACTHFRIYIGKEVVVSEHLGYVQYLISQLSHVQNLHKYVYTNMRHILPIGD